MVSGMSHTRGAWLLGMVLAAGCAAVADHDCELAGEGVAGAVLLVVPPHHPRQRAPNGEPSRRRAAEIVKHKGPADVSSFK